MSVEKKRIQKKQRNHMQRSRRNGKWPWKDGAADAEEDSEKGSNRKDINATPAERAS